jgi:AmiR/NasT family two-component response regulator
MPTHRTRSGKRCRGCATLVITRHADSAGMVQATLESMPDLVLVAGRGPSKQLREELSRWGGVPPVTIALVTPPIDAALHEELVALGIHAWIPLEGLDADALLSCAARARTRWLRETGLRSALAAALAQLEERKFIDRAKGLLMSARNIGEDEAFGLLRNASMHANLRLVEVSRSIIDAARWAEAINRAGQLRMLSQRLVRVAAQRTARVDIQRTRSLHSQSSLCVQDNLDRLAGLELDAAGAEARLRTRTAWEALRRTLVEPPSAGALRSIDAHAETLLIAADALTAALETAGARRALRIVNICGGQRMRAHRLAKDALLAFLLPAGPWTARLGATMTEFENALLDLEGTPLSSPDTRAALAAACNEWSRLVQGTLSTATAEGRAALVRSSEALAETFDDLTAAYEHSLQVIMP